jgi:hypothetical protein
MGAKGIVPVVRATEGQWGYLAGVIDGEGYIGCPMKQRPFIRVSQKYPAIINRLEQVFGGEVKYYSKPRSIYLWHSSPKLTYALLSGCLDYLTLKKPQAEVALKMWEVEDSEDRRYLNQLLRDLKRVELEGATQPYLHTC